MVCESLGEREMSGEIKNQRRVSRFRPETQLLGSSGGDLLKITTIGILALVVLLPLLTGVQPSTNSSNQFQIEENATIAAGPDNLLYLGLPGTYAITPGTTQGMNGFAYVNTAEERIYFVDPLTETTIDMALPAGYSLYTSLLAVDVDDNGDIEFLGLRRVTTLIVAVFIVDFDSDSYVEHTFSGVGATFYDTGDFNGDSQLDVAVLVNNNWLQMIDLATGTTLGTFDSNGNLRMHYAIGQFTGTANDQIAVTNNTFVYIINGDGSQAVNQSTPEYIRQMKTFNFGGGLSDLVLLDTLGFATARQGTDLSVIFSTQVGPVSQSLYAVVGNFTGDAQEDIYVQSVGWSTGLFLDGTNGTIIRETPGTVGYTSRLDIGNIDGEPSDDIVTETEFDNPCFIHGATGEIAYIETLIVDPSQIFTFDVDSNSRDDIFVRSLTDLYILLSEYDPPVIAPEPIDPVHPTVIDEIITLEIFVDEGSAIETAELFVRKLGTMEWTQPHGQLFTPDDKTYFAFLVGLEAGAYEYYYEIVDIYLNFGYDGNQTHPNMFEVTGHFAWEHDKSGFSSPRAFQSMAEGNETDGSTVIYTLELGLAPKTLNLSKYSSEGLLLDSYPIPFTDGQSFILQSGMIDGDSIIDPVAVVSADLQTKAYVLHGSTFSENYVSTAPSMIKTLNHYELFDGDGDSQDDLFLVDADQPYNISRMDASGSWTSALLPFPNTYSLYPHMIIGERGNEKGNNLTIVRGNTLIEVYDGSDITGMSSVDLAFGAYTKYEAKWLTTVKREGTQKESFILASTYWSGPIPETHLFAFDGGLTGSGDVDDYTIGGQDIDFVHPFDKEGDQIDELMLHMDDGTLSLANIAGPITFDWSIAVSDSTAINGLQTDFDGDLVDEFILFTKEDELLTAVSMDGEVERTAIVGAIANTFVVGNIDSGLGQDIAAYPVERGVDSSFLGVIRDIDWFYRLDVSIVDITSEIMLGNPFNANLTVTNIYGETVSDASIYVDAFYMTPEGPALNTFGSWFDWDLMLYRAGTDASWSMGFANISLSVVHQFYHSAERTYTNAVTVRSILNVDLQVPDIVHQGENTTFRVLVSDNLGGIVEGATVSVTIEGDTQSAVLSGQLYELEIPEIQLEAGPHIVEAVATHVYGIAPSNALRVFDVQVLTENLVISTDFPSTMQQDALVNAWFNITDPYGHVISGAIVTLRSGPDGYELHESLTDQGSYSFNHNITLSLGNQTFDLVVDRDHIFGPPAALIEFDVIGNLTPIVSYDSRVEGGSIFNIHVFVRDKYGPIFQGTSVSIDINGTIYSQTNLDGTPDYDFPVVADFLMGSNNFSIYVNATYANQWFQERTIRAYADASASSTVFPEGEWIVPQGERTSFELILEDHLGRPVSTASVTIYVRALSYVLIEVAPGVYMTNITTVGWAPGEYQYTAAVDHEDIETGDPIQGNITILGTLELFIDYNPDTPTQGDPLWITIAVIDAYGNPIPGLEIFVTTLNMPTTMAEESDQVGEYVVWFEHLPLTEGYGLKNVSIVVNGEFVIPKEIEDTFTLAVRDPDIGVMSVDALTSFGILSFVFSLIGMFLYFRLAPTLRSKGTSKEELRKSVKRMDRLYLLIVLISAVGLFGSILLYSFGEYGGALILTVVLLGASVLLYGLWLYRDAVSAVMIKGALNRKRMIAGLWHLFFVPVVIILMMTYGTEIDWFKAYMIDDAFVIGNLQVPAIMTTIFTAYLSSILVVVVNLYREVSTGLKKLRKMEDANTPVSILEDERGTMVSRYSSSIRIKFLMFLVVVGAAAVTTMDFLQSYQLGVIVLMPVAFLVVIPFISSKIVKVINQATSVRIRKSDSSLEDNPESEVGETVEIDDSNDDESELD